MAFFICSVLPVFPFLPKLAVGILAVVAALERKSPTLASARRGGALAPQHFVVLLKEFQIAMFPDFGESLKIVEFGRREVAGLRFRHFP